MIRFGVIGSGNIAHTFCQAMSVVSGAELYAIASRDLDKAKRYQAEYNIAKAYGSYVALLEDPLVDCVYIATPHGLHYEQMMLVLDYHKAILCEKAFTLNERQAKEVFEKASTLGLFVMEAMWTRFLPTIKAVKSLCDEGAIGEITELEASLCFKIDVPNTNRVFAKALGGGALLDVGIYPITFANLILGVPKNIEATMTKARTDVDASNDIIYHYDRAKAYLKSSVVEASPPNARIVGTKGSILIPRFWSASEAYVYDVKGNLVNIIKHPHEVNGFEYEIREVVRCLNAKKLESPKMTHTQSLTILKQMDTIRNMWSLTYPQET